MTIGTDSDANACTLRVSNRGSDQWPPNVTTMPAANPRCAKKYSSGTNQRARTLSFGLGAFAEVLHHTHKRG